MPSAWGDLGPVTIRVDAARSLGPLNRALTGVGWHPGNGPLAVVDALDPAVVRVDASLQEVSPAPGVLHLDPLLAHVAEVRALGAEPLVILSYMPAWLGSPNALGRDPTRVAPADLDAWETLVRDVVRALATAPSPAHRFEAWNEPDIPVFWQDTPAAWTAMITRTARAIGTVESETGLDLSFGGPATAFPDPVYLAAFLLPLRDRSLPLDFVSWHYYGNTPFLGPDGNEFAVIEPLHPLLGQRNPLTTPAIYGPQVTVMRASTALLLAGSGREPPGLIIDEWNLSPGGFDRRHDSHEGAAFAAAVLIELQDAGLDEAAYFQVGDAPRATGGDRYGGHGLTGADGRPKPAWWALWSWQQQGDERVAVAGTPLGVWAHAARDPGRVTVLLSSFAATGGTAREIALDLQGVPWPVVTATVRRLDDSHADASSVEPVPVEGTTARLRLPANAVALVELTPG